MKRFFRWLRSFFAWRVISKTGVWVYYENSITGRRHAAKGCTGYQPLDFKLLRPGDTFDCPVFSRRTVVR